MPNSKYWIFILHTGQKQIRIFQDTSYKSYYRCRLFIITPGQAARGTWPLACLKITQILKSQAPQGFSGCLDIDNDEMNNKFFLSASPRVKQTLRSLLYFRMKQPIMKKMFGPKNGTFKPQNGLSFNIFHHIEPNLEIKFSLKFYHQGAWISRGLKRAKNGLWKSKPPGGRISNKILFPNLVQCDEICWSSSHFEVWKYNF